MRRKTFRILFSLIALVCFLPLIFPVFEWANRAEPMIIGLPFNFFWVLLWMVITFICVLTLYFLDPDNKRDRGDK